MFTKIKRALTLLFLNEIVVSVTKQGDKDIVLIGEKSFLSRPDSVIDTVQIIQELCKVLGYNCEVENQLFETILHIR